MYGMHSSFYILKSTYEILALMKTHPNLPGSTAQFCQVKKNRQPITLLFHTANKCNKYNNYLLQLCVRSKIVVDATADSDVLGLSAMKWHFDKDRSFRGDICEDTMLIYIINIWKVEL